MNDKVELPVLQCSAQRIDGDRVLLSCGDAFLKTDNKGLADMATVLIRLLAFENPSKESEAHDPSHTIPGQGICSEKSSDGSQSVQWPLIPSCQTQTHNKSPSHRRKNVVHLFCVVSYGDGWPNE